MNVDSRSELLWFCFTTLCDWLKKRAPPTQPIRCKTKTNPDFLARFLALGTGYVYLLPVMIGSVCY